MPALEVLLPSLLCKMELEVWYRSPKVTEERDGEIP